MLSASSTSVLLSRLLWPEEIPIDGPARDRAQSRIREAGLAGVISDIEAQDRYEHLQATRTRRDLRRVLAGVPGGVAPHGLATALRISSVLSIATLVVDFLVWTMICLIGGHVEQPWWLLSIPISTIAVAALSWTYNSYYRPGHAISTEAAKPGA